MKSKGVSPLIATVALIALAIIAAYMVSSWLLPYINTTTRNIEQRNEIECSQASVYVREAKYDCASGLLSLLTENNGDIELESFKVNIVYGNLTSVSYELGSKIEPGVRSLLQANILNSVVSSSSGFYQLVLFSQQCPARGDTFSGSSIQTENC